MGLSTFERGVHPSYYKEQTSSRRIETAALPKTVIIPLQQHAGAPCEPLVKKGDAVAEGQKIGDVKAFVSAPVHSSVSGKVKEVEYYLTPTAQRSLSVVIESDGSTKDWNTSRGPVDTVTLAPELIRETVREAGIVGMGGAAFPTSVKLVTTKGRTIDTVLLNGCECEPYLTADHRIMVEEADKVIRGLKALMRATSALKGYIGVEENKPDAIAALEKAIAGNPEIKIAVLETKYPQGAEKMLIKAVLNRKVPAGKLPLDVGVVVNNVGTAAAIYEALNLGKPLIDRVITVSGNGVAEPKNLRVRIGTPFADILSQCGGLKQDNEEKEVLNGGPMMGIAQSTLNVPVLKGTSGITVLSAANIKPLKYDPCIRCARCVEACPMGLMPYRLGDYGRVNMVADFKSWSGLSCIECGCCSYVCPSKRPLLQWIRVGKLMVRKEAKAAGA